MCQRVKNCDRHGFSYGFCLPHYREFLQGDAPVETEKEKVEVPIEDIDSVVVQQDKKKRSTKKKVDAEELETREQ